MPSMPSSDAAYVDLGDWQRRAQFDLFRTYDHPHFNLCTHLDATALRTYVRSRSNTSLSLAYLWIVLREVNALEPFRYRLRGDRVLIHEQIDAGSTLLLDDTSFTFTYFGYHATFSAFQQEAQATIARVRAGETDFSPRNDRDDLIHCTVVPWVAFTSLAHPRRHNRDDSVPKIAFGKIHEAEGQWRLPISVEVHHALMDGWHVGQFLTRVQAALDEPAATLALD